MVNQSSSSAPVTVFPLEPCHECRKMAPCVAVPVVRYASGWECSLCRTPRWGGVTHVSGPRTIGLACANGVNICWRCAEGTTPPGQYLPALDYVHGPVGPITTLSEYKNDAFCDECGRCITSDM